MLDRCEEYMTGKHMTDVTVTKIKSIEQQSEHEKCIFKINTAAVNSEVILDSHSLVASTLKE